MKHALTMLRIEARKLGYPISIYSFNAASRDAVALVGLNGVNTDVKTWLKAALPDSASVYNLTTQCAAELADARRALYEIFSLTPKELCDCLAATELLVKFKRRNLDRAKQLYYLSNYAGYAAFVAFIARVFEMTTKDLLASPAAAEKKLKQRFPKIAPVLLENADVLFAENETQLFLVVIKEKTEPQNGRKILLTKSDGGNRLAE